MTFAVWGPWQRGALTNGSHEVREVAIEARRDLEMWSVTDAGIHQQRRVRDHSGGVMCGAQLHDAIVAAMHDQCRHANAREHVIVVEETAEHGGAARRRDH